MENSSPFSAAGGDIEFSRIYIPTHILVNILLQVPAEKIFICKSVCKAWYKIISDPQFLKLYFERGDVYPLVRPVDHSHVSRTLYFVDPKYYTCDSSSKMSLKTKFKIPVHKSEMLFESETQTKLTQIVGGMKRKRCLELKPHDHKFDIINACKGFLCLSNEDLAVICNPITGEYVNVNLPRPNVTQLGGLPHHWLGFSPRSNNYKVISMYGQSSDKWCTNRPLRHNYYDFVSNYAQIQILGSKSWQDIGLAPLSFNLNFPTFLNGTLNWVYFDSSIAKFIASFDFDNHRFGSFSLPPCASTVKLCRRMRIGVLRDKLCYCNATKDEFLHVWVMSEYGVDGSWTKVCNVRLSGDQSIGCHGLYLPISQLENGAILLFHKKDSKRSGLIYYEPEAHILRCFSFRGNSASFEAVAFSPSFTMLKDVLVGDEVEILNVKSRCAELKLPKENITPFLVQKNIVQKPYSDEYESLDYANQDYNLS